MRGIGEPAPQAACQSAQRSSKPSDTPRLLAGFGDGRRSIPKRRARVSTLFGGRVVLAGRAPADAHALRMSVTAGSAAAAVVGPPRSCFRAHCRSEAGRSDSHADRDECLAPRARARRHGRTTPQLRPTPSYTTLRDDLSVHQTRRIPPIQRHQRRRPYRSFACPLSAGRLPLFGFDLLEQLARSSSNSSSASGSSGTSSTLASPRRRSSSSGPVSARSASIPGTLPSATSTRNSSSSGSRSMKTSISGLHAEGSTQESRPACTSS